MGEKSRRKAEKRERWEKRGDKEPAQRDGKIAETNVSQRRQFLRLSGAGILGLTALGSLIAYLRRGDIADVMSNEPPYMIIAKRHGTPVLDERNGNGSTAILGIRQHHGGVSSLPFFRLQPKHLNDHLDHQDAIYQQMHETIEAVGPEHVLIICEGLIGEPQEWSEKIKKGIADIGKLEQRKAGASGKERIELDRRLRAATHQIVQRDTEEAMGAVQLNYSGYRIAAHCMRKGGQGIIGADLPGDPFSTRFHHALDELAARAKNAGGDLSDAELDGFIAHWKREHAEDTRRRHEHIAYLVRKGKSQGKTVIMILLGAGHFNVGTSDGSVQKDRGLEEDLRGIADSRLIVTDPHKLEAVLRLPELPPHKKLVVIDTETLDRETLRIAIEEKLKQRK